MKEDRTRMEGTMVATHERRFELGRGGSLVAGFVISCLITPSVGSKCRSASAARGGTRAVSAVATFGRTGTERAHR